ncbi:hypothetical protein [Bradyrhizobium sp. JR3.5]
MTDQTFTKRCGKEYGVGLISLDLPVGPIEKRAIDHITDWLPQAAVKLHKPHLLDRPKVVWTGIIVIPSERDQTLKILQRRGPAA